MTSRLSLSNLKANGAVLDAAGFLALDSVSSVSNYGFSKKVVV
jgi:hypothetical protein